MPPRLHSRPRTWVPFSIRVAGSRTARNLTSASDDAIELPEAGNSLPECIHHGPRQRLHLLLEAVIASRCMEACCWPFAIKRTAGTESEGPLMRDLGQSTAKYPAGSNVASESSFNLACHRRPLYLRAAYSVVTDWLTSLVVEDPRSTQGTFPCED